MDAQGGPYRPLRLLLGLPPALCCAATSRVDAGAARQGRVSLLGLAAFTRMRALALKNDQFFANAQEIMRVRPVSDVP